MENYNIENYHEFFRTMYERQLIWKRRFIDKLDRKLWTNDKIFQTYKFTNVYRELDRNSQYCINKIILQNKNENLQNLLWKTLVYRLFNNPNTFEEASKYWPCGIPDYNNFYAEQNSYLEFMNALSLEGNIFTSAYLIRSSAENGQTRTECYINKVLPRLNYLIDNLINVCKNAITPEMIINKLMEIPGVASFIAYELYNDMLYINRFTDYKLIPFDANAYVNVGPGSSMGIKLIYPSIKTKKECKCAMFNLLYEAPKQLELLSNDYIDAMPFAFYDNENKRYNITNNCNFVISNIEHWLCEYSKYYRLANMTGKKQKLFKPISKNNMYE